MYVIGLRELFHTVIVRCDVASLFLGRRDVLQSTSSIEIGSHHSCQPVASSHQF